MKQDDSSPRSNGHFVGTSENDLHKDTFNVMAMHERITLPPNRPPVSWLLAQQRGDATLLMGTWRGWGQKKKPMFAVDNVFKVHVLKVHGQNPDRTTF